MKKSPNSSFIKMVKEEFNSYLPHRETLCNLRKEIEALAKNAPEEDYAIGDNEILINHLIIAFEFLGEMIKGKTFDDGEALQAISFYYNGNPNIMSYKILAGSQVDGFVARLEKMKVNLVKGLNEFTSDVRQIIIDKLPFGNIAGVLEYFNGQVNKKQI